MKWEKKGIILKTEDLEADWIVSHVQVPVPVKIDNETLRIYFTARNKDCHGLPIYIDVDISNFNIKKINTVPLLNLGRIGSFDENGVSFSSCISYKGKMYMYYIGWNKGYNIPYKNSIGLAISEDGGNSFYKYSEGPILDRCLEYPYFVATPFVNVEKENMEMYFLSCTEWELWENEYVPHYLIKKAFSNDGIHWNKEDDNCINYNNPYEAIARPWVIKQNGKYYMWYSYRGTHDFRHNKDNGYMIGVAISNDGKTWLRKDDQVGIKKGNVGWDSEMMCYPAVIDNGDDLIMLYNGNEHGRFAFGYAVCNKEELRRVN
jgi:hypothetical protein